MLRHLISGDVVDAFWARGDVRENEQRHALHLGTTLQTQKRKQESKVSDALNVGAWNDFTKFKFLELSVTWERTRGIDLLCKIQGRSEQFLWYGPNSKIAPLKFFFWTLGRNCAPQILFSDFGAEMAPSSLKKSPFSGGGGGSNGGIFVKFAPLKLHHYGPWPRRPPPLLRPW